MKEEYSPSFRRWYDKDPVLSSAMKTLEESDDETQIKISLNLIKIIIEHNLENAEFEAVEDIISAVEAVTTDVELATGAADSLDAVVAAVDVALVVASVATTSVLGAVTAA